MAGDGVGLSQVKAVGGGTAGIWWVEAGDAARHRAVPGTAPASGNHPANMSAVPRLRNLATHR